MKTVTRVDVGLAATGLGATAPLRFAAWLR